MIDSTLYDLLEKLVNEQEDELKKYQDLYGSDQNESQIGINTVQSIVRRSVIEEASEEPSYLKVVYTKDGYQSIKINNLRIDFDFILTLLSNAAGVKKLDKWAILMVILTIVVQLTKCNVELSPAMGKIITFLYENGYQSKMGKSISEDELWKEMQRNYNKEDSFFSDQAQLYECINKLEVLKVIELAQGKISLKEELKI